MTETPPPEPYLMTDREIARGTTLDATRPSSRPLVDGPVSTPRAELEAAMLTALEHEPCVVAFSGGRDSSALLALGAMLARREGLALPIAATRRFPHLEETREDDWQELVIRHVGGLEWEKLDLTDELDLIGPYAQSILRRYGIVWTPLVHQHLPVLELARGGVTVDGEGGDQLLGLEMHRVGPLVASLRIPRWRTPRRLLGAASSLLPGPTQTRVQRYRFRHNPSPWLHPDERRAFERERAREAAVQPLRWDASIRAFLRNGKRRRTYQTVAALAAWQGARAMHPFLTPRFMEAMARTGGSLGMGTRTEVMAQLFADVLPDAVLARRSKAFFNAAVHAGPSRAFADAWDGTGVDTALVDVEQLRACWRQPMPPGRTHALLQRAWLHANPSSDAKP